MQRSLQRLGEFVPGENAQGVSVIKVMIYVFKSYSELWNKCLWENADSVYML